MSLIPFRHGWLWEPWEDFDRFFGELPEMKAAEFVPLLDIYEKEGKVVVKTSIDGIDPKKVDISIEDHILTIKGKSERKSEVEEKNYYRREIKYGNFYRTVVLPVKINENNAEASYEGGILKIEIPKAPESKKEKKVKITVKSKK